MSTLGIVLISLLGGMFLVVLLASAAVLVYYAVALRKQQAELGRQATAVYAETHAMLAGQAAEMKAAVEAAKNSFQTVRQETKTILEGHRENLKTTLEDHRAQMKTGIDKINGEALQAAAARSLEACMRLEKAAAVIQTLFLDNENRVAGEMADEEMAPEKTRFHGPPSGYSVSQTATLDSQDDVVTAMAAEILAGDTI